MNSPKVAVLAILSESAITMTTGSHSARTGTWCLELICVAMVSDVNHGTRKYDAYVREPQGQSPIS